MTKWDITGSSPECVCRWDDDDILKKSSIRMMITTRILKQLIQNVVSYRIHKCLFEIICFIFPDIRAKLKMADKVMTDERATIHCNIALKVSK